MAAPEENQFWKLRTKHGRGKLFESPEVLWTEACKYFEFCDSEPLIEIDFKGKDATEVKIPKMRAYTWTGLELFLNLDSLRWYKTSDSHKDFLQVITRIDKVIYTQKFVGSAAGFLNPNIIARDLGLTDKQDINTNTPQPVIIMSASLEEEKMNQKTLDDIDNN